MADLGDITDLLNAANSGDSGAQEAAYALVYGELKRCAQRQKNAAPGSSLSSTALVHELFLRFNQRRVAKIHSRTHFFALSARAMRQIIIDHARLHQRLKRGGGVEFTGGDSSLNLSDKSADQAIELDAALNRLSERDPDLARIVEWHFFAGLSFGDIGTELGRHERTVEREWALARVLLQQFMVETPSP